MHVVAEESSEEDDIYVFESDSVSYRIAFTGDGKLSITADEAEIATGDWSGAGASTVDMLDPTEVINLISALLHEGNYKVNNEAVTEEAVEEDTEVDEAQNVTEKDISRKKQWFIYIPEEGDWPIKYDGDSKEEAKAVYLKWAKIEKLPAGSRIWWGDIPKIAKK